MNQKGYEEAIYELARFLGIDHEEVRRRAVNYKPGILAEEWRLADPKTPQEVKNFYKSTNNYFYDLLMWNYLSPVYQKEIAPLLHYHGQKILEIGGGVGTLSIALAYGGNEITYFDIASKLRDFAIQRFNDRRLDVKVINSMKEAKTDYYDIVIAQDTLEHIHPDELKPLFIDISSALKSGGFLYHRSHFGQQREIYPQHFEDTKDYLRLAKEAGLELRANGDLMKSSGYQGVRIAMPILEGKMDLSQYYSLELLKKPRGSVKMTVPHRAADIARNILSENLDKDWIFYYDADVNIPTETIVRLLEWDLPVVTGLVLMRTGFPEPQIYSYYYKKDKGHWYLPKVEEVYAYLRRHEQELKAMGSGCGVIPCTREELIPCDGVGADCLLVHKKVLDSIEKPYFKYGEGTTSQEDFYFCRKIRDAGFDIYCDPGVLCEHNTSYSRSWKHFLSWAGKEPFPWKEG